MMGEWKLYCVTGIRKCHRDVTSKRFVAAPASVAKHGKFEPAGGGVFDNARSTSERRHRKAPYLAAKQPRRNDGKTEIAEG